MRLGKARESSKDAQLQQVEADYAKAIDLLAKLVAQAAVEPPVAARPSSTLQRNLTTVRI